MLSTTPKESIFDNLLLQGTPMTAKWQRLKSERFATLPCSIDAKVSSNKTSSRAVKPRPM